MASQQLAQVLDHLQALGDNISDMGEEADILQIRATTDNYAAATPECMEPVGDTRFVEADGVPALWHSGPGTDPGRRILYIHGGGWVAGSPNTTKGYQSRIARAAGACLLSIDYRLAPEHPYPAGLDDCLRAYAWLLENGPEGASPATNIFIMGDSAGGNMTLATLFVLLQRGLRLPDGAVALSPATDAFETGGSYTSCAETDPVAAKGLIEALVRAYAQGGEDFKDPTISPLYGDPAGFPPLLIHAGGAEMLRDDSVMFAEKAEAAGVDVTLEIWDDMPHVWHMFAPLLPEAGQAIDRIGEFVRQHAGS